MNYRKIYKCFVIMQTVMLLFCIVMITYNNFNTPNILKLKASEILKVQLYEKSIDKFYDVQPIDSEKKEIIALFCRNINPTRFLQFDNDMFNLEDNSNKPILYIYTKSEQFEINLNTNSHYMITVTTKSFKKINRNQEIWICVPDYKQYKAVCEIFKTM